ncbi:ubiquinone biosynthesis monooxygenase COQ6, mitochondrial [Stomoxys calcitrans]|uniref:ubiquinone biosynthesis monooxygenase COQ6, mitochondrial n=1 Tax=Stomoxys calcitrans TaxID=35570 RepID=UPI0027E38035|nr:ubiquinone biosynthesis monooxygenase COQ6, mitochondrial [Stomoxys calcitrans]
MSLLLKNSTRVGLRNPSILLRSFCVSSSAKESNATDEHYDIIIGGGGLVGTALAAALSKNKTLADKSILLLEGAPPFKGFDVSKPYGNRVSAINKKTISLFESIGIWERMTNARVKPVKQMQVWDANSDALINFQHEHFADDVACIVENDLMLDSIYGQLKENAPNVMVRNLSRISDVKLPSKTGKNVSEVTLQGGEKFSCELLIGADGANSMVRKEMGVDVYSMDYKRMGLVATLELGDAGDNSVAWQRFIPTGPVALLPLTDKLSSLVWSTTVPHAKELLNMSSENFVDALNEAFCKEYPKNEAAVKALDILNSMMGRNTNTLRQYPPRVCGVLDKSRATFPLGFLHASSYICSGAALIGDAAHRVHPLAGQGVNLGFSDVSFLVECLAEGAYAGAKLGDKQYLMKYEQRSLMKNVPILVGIHGLHTLYTTTFSPVVFLRSLGLQLTNNIPQIKDVFMKRAMG